jgi:calcineurin-like phosphoesterase family protein
MQVYFISDLHLGHRTIMMHTIRIPGADRGQSQLMVDPLSPLAVDEHDQWVMERLYSVKPSKRTLWWFLGDVSTTPGGLNMLAELPGRKKLVLGNHDLFHHTAYAKVFESLHGTIKKYGMWISHVPVHETELLRAPNIHGHAHHNQLRDDPRYMNVCIEWVKGPVSLDAARAYFGQGEAS